MGGSANRAMAQENPHIREESRQAATPAAPPGNKSSASDTVTKVTTEVSSYADTDHVYVFTPAAAASINSPTTGWNASGSYLIDIVSAASVDIVSTASRHWVETRHAASLSGGFKPGTVGTTLSGSVSREPDYLSLSGGGAIALELKDKTVNPTFGYTYTHDTAGRKTTPFSVFSQELVRHTAQAALELILDPETLVSLSVDAIFEVGNQTKPYRLLPMFAPDVAAGVPKGASINLVNRERLPGRVAEQLPLTRNRVAGTARIAQRLAGSTFVVSERLYADDWGVKASTTDLRFVIDASRRVFLWTHLRGHIQSGVSFWHRAYTATFNGDGSMTLPKWRTGDREESSLAGGTIGLGMRWNIGSAGHPEGLSFVAQADMITTVFNDVLFIQNREGYLGVLQLEAEF